MNYESLRYVVGYIAFKLLEKYPHLEIKNKSMPENNTSEFS